MERLRERLVQSGSSVGGGSPEVECQQACRELHSEGWIGCVASKTSRPVEKPAHPTTRIRNSCCCCSSPSQKSGWSRYLGNKKSCRDPQSKNLKTTNSVMLEIMSSDIFNHFQSHLSTFTHFFLFLGHFYIFWPLSIIQGVFFLHWYPPKKLKYGKPRLGVSTLT